MKKNRPFLVGEKVSCSPIFGDIIGQIDTILPSGQIRVNAGGRIYSFLNDGRYYAEGHVVLTTHTLDPRPGFWLRGKNSIVLAVGADPRSNTWFCIQRCFFENKIDYCLEFIRPSVFKEMKFLTENNLDSNECIIWPNPKERT